MTIEVVNGWPNPDSLTKEQLVDLVMDLQGCLWAGEDEKPDPGKEWQVDTIEHVADILERAGMKPKEV